ncbi:hypothetical protein HYV84_05415, partial [Candidatus Woesearchaeota archaeon]|nr:hypothetical protein [Candidatus Woesearchaeota archaeon]
MPLEEKKPFAYDLIREGQETTLWIDCEQYTKVPSLEDDPETFSKTC